MKFYGAGYAPLGYLKGSVPEAHRRNVAHRISKSAHQVAKLRDNASDTHIRHVLNTAELGYPVGALVDYHGTLFKIVDRYFVGPDAWSKGYYRYVIQDVETEVLDRRGVREESISLHV